MNGSSQAITRWNPNSDQLVTYVTSAGIEAPDW